jgi:phosphate:Na+ symporter
MAGDIVLALGGVGLFLLGMQLMTEGMRDLAGLALRRRLATLTSTPLSGAVTGAVATAMVQSSSAVIVAAVGFVGAGLMTFPQALGVVFGANVGTTVTGWLVALIGFKLQLGQLALPLVLAGALARLFGRGRWRPGGLALAGFGLLFSGIGAMQGGLAGWEGAVTPDDFPGDDWAGRLQLLALGMLITVITQSSSAGVAAALVALHAGAIAFPQAAALVIGMNVGTTFTALLAAVGGASAARRSAIAHLVYNVLTGALALALLGALGPWLSGIGAGGPGDAQLALVAFHTGFNVMGAALALPFAAHFARLIIRLTPEPRGALDAGLDDTLLQAPNAALDAAAATLSEIARRLIGAAAALADPARPDPPEGLLSRLEAALAETRGYLDRIPGAAHETGAQDRLIASFHALDHLERLQRRCADALARRDARAEARRDPRLRRLLRVAASVWDRLPVLPGPRAAADRADRLRRLLRAQREPVRARAIAALAAERVDADQAVARLDAIRWLHRVSYHAWRISEHLERAGPGLAALSP